MKKEITTPDADAVPGVLSQAVDTGGLVFVSGQINVTPSGDMVGQTVEEKLAQIMKNITAVLAAADLTLDDIAKATIYVTDLAQMPEINKHYPTYFSAVLPAREAVGVKELPLGATIEISVIAARQQP
jgi:2-iminobutanoate/2-iminopropanoate deaminase